MLISQVALSWSSGKDSAWALHLLRQIPEFQVTALITTLNKTANRVAMHAVRKELLEAQALRTGLPVWQVNLPWPCPNEVYENLMGGIYQRAASEGVTKIAFGDLFLEDIRAYRILQMEATGIQPIFPVWGIPTRELAWEMIRAGVKARVTCVDPAKLDRTYAGREFDAEFLLALPEQVDPCGENGEFHTFVYDGPMFSEPVPVTPGEIVERDGFVFADVLPL